MINCGLPAVGIDECAGVCPDHCHVGIMRNQHLLRLAETDNLTIQALERSHDKDAEHNHEFHGCPLVKNTHLGNGTYKGAFAFTLTKSPDDELTEFDMIKAVRKIMSQKSCPVIKYAWYLEYKEDNTHPHIHGMYETETQGRIEKKHWKRAWPIWDEAHKLGQGFRGGYHRKVRSDEGYSSYIKKDAGKSESFNAPADS